MDRSGTGKPMQTERVQSAADEPDCVSTSHPEAATRVLLLAVALGLCDQIYWMYSSMDRYQAGYWNTFIDGAGPAPEQYRIGVKFAAWWMVEHLGWGFRHGFALMDVAGTLTAVYLIYALLQRRPDVRAASPALKWFASAAFVALTCFYFAWVGSFFRPETLPTVGFVAVMVWLWTTWDGTSSGSERLWRVVALIVASLLQAFIRADVPFALNAGMVLGCVVTRRRRARDRGWKIAIGVLCVAIAGAVQLYLMMMKYPHASYGPVPVLMVRYDFRHPLKFVPFVCFMLPVAWTFARFWRDRAYKLLNQADVGLVIASVLYLVLWIVMGKPDEVRIFVPFALALAPLTVDLAMRRISPDGVKSKTLLLDSSA
jgi:hypothetical protein